MKRIKLFGNTFSLRRVRMAPIFKKIHVNTTYWPVFMTVRFYGLQFEWMRPQDAGSWPAIRAALLDLWYSWWLLVDQLSHAIGFDATELGYRLCQWAHREDWEDEEEQ